jgi:Mg/Co/Ni transporter MgtE
MQSNLKQLYEFCSKYELSHVPLVNGDNLCIGYFTYSEILKKYIQFSTHASAAVFREVLAQKGQLSI